MKRRALIVDVDGTIAIRGERSPYDDHLAGDDTPNTPVINAVLGHAERANLAIVVMSGRDEGRSRLVTAEWLFAQDIGYDVLLMRPAGDNRKDAIVKRELYDLHVRDAYDVEVVYDDRNQVVEMWRNELGLPCFQVAAGDF